MALIILVFYMVILIIRPMDWWAPLLGVSLVDNVAMLLIPAVFLTLKGGDFRRWLDLPETKLSFLTLIGFSLSWLPLSRLGVMTTFLAFGKIILLYCMIVLVGTKRRNFHILFRTLLICIVWMAIHGILQNLRGYGFGGQAPLYREGDGVYQIVAFGVFNDPNDLCLIFIIGIPLLYAEFRASQNNLVKLMILAVVPLVVYAAWLTNSRGGVVGIFGMLTTHAIINTRGIKRWLVIIASVMLISVVAPSRFATKLAVDANRTTYWGMGISSFKSTPIFGAGLGNFSEITGGAVAHNSFVETLAETGVVGYFPWLMLIYFTCLHLYRALRLKKIKEKERQEWFYLSAIISALSGFLVAIYFISRGTNFVLYLLLALACAKTAGVAGEPDLHKDVFGGWKSDLKRALFFCCGSIVFLWLSVRLAKLIARGI